MNYLSHGVAFLDQPLVMAGSVVPDLLSVVDRRCRLRLRRIEPLLADDSLAASTREIILGFQAHLADDNWFHGSQAFLEVSGQMTRYFRDAMPDDDTHRVGFLGHIVVELLLDRWIIEHKPETLDRFYKAFAAVDPQFVEHAVGLAASRKTDRLLPFWHRFVEERFLADYCDTELMLFRLNQVMQRVKLPNLDDEIQTVLARGYELVRTRACDLLPPRVIASL